MTNDPELEELFQDPAHREVVDLLKLSRPAAPPLDPNFRTYLRTKLMTEAHRTLRRRAGPISRFQVRVFDHRPKLQIAPGHNYLSRGHTGFRRNSGSHQPVKQKTGAGRHHKCENKN